MAWKTDEVYKYLSGESRSNEVYYIHKIHYGSETELIFFLVYIIILFIVIFIFLSGCIHALFNSFCKCCKREDHFRYSYFFIFTIYFWENLCDILFISFVFINHYDNSASITNEYTILLLIALSCLSVTYLLNIILCCRIIYVLHKHNKGLHYWFHSYRHSVSFITVSLITFGPFMSVPLFNSNLFGLSLCSMQISKYDINYILSQKFLNVITQLLPLFFLRMLYLFWIQTFNVMILSSLIPIALSFCISSWYLCCSTFHYTNKDKYLLRSFFEVSGAHLSPLRHLGLTKHLQNRFCQLFNIKNNEMEVFKPVDCSDSITSRFEIRFIVKSDEERLERVEHKFLSYAQNEELVKVIAETYNIHHVYINKQMAEIVKNVHLIWGSKPNDEMVHVYGNIPDNKSEPHFDPFGKQTANIYQRGELRNVHIDISDHKHIQGGYQAMKSRSSSSFNHPPIHDVYQHDIAMAGITEEDKSDDENQELFHRQRHKVADASSLDQINPIYETNDIEPTTPKKQRCEEDDQFDINYQPLSSQEIRLKNWETYCAQTNKYKHKHVMTPSFSISTMDHHEGDSLGSIIASPSRPRPKTTASRSTSHMTMISVSEIAGEQEVEEDVQIAKTLDFELEIEEEELIQELQLDTTASITHQTKSVMVDPKDVAEALSSYKPSFPIHMAVPEDETRSSVEEVKAIPIQPPASVDSDYVYERDHSESVGDEEIDVDVQVHYDQILHKPRTSRVSWEYQNEEMQLVRNEEEDEETSSDSYDTHTPTGDTEQDSTSRSSSDTVIVHKTHYQYNKIITLNTNKQK